MELETKRSLTTWTAWAVALVAMNSGCNSQVDDTYLGEPLMTINGQVESQLMQGADLEVGVLWLTSGGLLPAGTEETSIECDAEFASAGPNECELACGNVVCETEAQFDEWVACLEACPENTVTSVSISTELGSPFSGGVGQTTPVAGEFPAQFQLDVLQPPPEGSLGVSPDGQGQLAFGLFVALNPEKAPWELNLQEYSSGPPSWLRGGSGSHALLYSPNGVAPDSELGQFLGQFMSESLGPGFQLVELNGDYLGPEDAPPMEDNPDEPERPIMTQVPAGEATQITLEIAPPETIDWPLPYL